MIIPRLDISFSLRRQWSYWFGKEYNPIEGEFLLNHARTGIVMALRVALPKGGRVGVVAYNCHTVANAVANAMCTPVFVDVTDGLTIDIQSVPKDLDAIVVTNLFGIRNDIEAIRKRSPKAVIIVDNAHGYGLPAEGDFTVYSINQGKFPALGCGGILCVNIKENKNKENREENIKESDSKSKMNNPAPQDTAYAASSVIANHLDNKQAYLQANCQSLSDNSNNLPLSDYSEKNDSTFESTKNAKNVLETIDEMYAALPEYGFIAQVKLFCSMLMKAIAYSKLCYWLVLRLKKTANPDVHEKVTMRKMAPGVGRLYKAWLPNAEAETANQKQNAERISGLVVSGECFVGENAFMVVVKCESPEELKKDFAAREVETETHFKHCIEWAEQFGYKCGSCPKAEELTTKLLMIPTYTRI